MGDSHPPNCLQWLNRHRCPEVKPGKYFKEAEGYQYPQWIHLINGDITHDKRNQSAQVTKSTGKFHFVIVISPKSHIQSCYYDSVCVLPMNTYSQVR